jgi:hypothetical protein
MEKVAETAVDAGAAALTGMAPEAAPFIAAGDTFVHAALTASTPALE